MQTYICLGSDVMLHLLIYSFILSPIFPRSNEIIGSKLLLHLISVLYWL